MVDKENTNPNVLQPNAELKKSKRKMLERRNYLRRKEDRLRRIANGEGSSQSPTSVEVPIIETHLSSETELATSTIEQQSQDSSQSFLNVDNISAIDPFDFLYIGLPTDHRVLEDQDLCEFCGAIRLQFEVPTFCCMQGKTRLAIPAIPNELHDIFTRQDVLGKLFKNTVRAYNTSFSFASMGVTLDNRVNDNTSGVYTFRAHGTIYHTIDQFIPRDGQARYLQLYFYEGESEISERLKWPNLDRRIVEILTHVLDANPYVLTLKHLSELEPLDEYVLSLTQSVELDQRSYCRPRTSEVAGIWVEGNENVTAHKRSIIVHARSNKTETIRPHYACYDPLCYPLFFPYGEPGWHPRIPRHGVDIADVQSDNENSDDGEDDSSGKSKSRITVTMREYYCYKLQIRRLHNLILLGGRLLQQFVVDTYIKIETCRLAFCEFNQTKIRAELYQGVVDSFTSGETDAGRIGTRTVLPPSFIGGPRDMRRRFLDAMALVQNDGRPDIFLTITCNPKWKEITELLLPGQTATDRPDIAARVFRAKLEDLKNQLFKKHVLGQVGAYVYVVEFQKRGLPHAHMLLILRSQSKINSPDDYDKLVSAELPDPIKFPKLHELVKNHMMHGPCGPLKPDSPCMEGEDGKVKTCRFRYPRQFNDHTSQGEDSYPVYRRRNNGRHVVVQRRMLDNRWVAPYNPTLLMMYNCHINVEVCSSIKSVKYLFKYVYKGHDKQMVHLDNDTPVDVNEIRMFQDARYVSPPEAIWRVFGFDLTQNNPPVLALQIHLPNNHRVTFTEYDTMEDVVRKGRDKRTMLTAFFEANLKFPNARRYLYRDFPKHFTWNKKNCCWKPRKQRTQVGRLVSSYPSQGERYFLRLLLCHVRGPTCFKDLYTYKGILHPTFRTAALERGLLESDSNLMDCLSEAALFHFPNAIRTLFATIMIFCEPGNVRMLWDAHYDSLAEDYRNEYASPERVRNMVLIDIRRIVQSMGKKFDSFGLPNITMEPNVDSGQYREVQEELSVVVPDEHLHARDSLNPDQISAYNIIMNHVIEGRPGVFFIDGPGGTGKTFLYKALLAEIRSHGYIAVATATSGVAANNMPGGRTAHSRFRLPLIIDNNSMCLIQKQSGTAQLLGDAKIIIWDEASMARRQAVEAVSRSLQDIMGNNLPFGGKVMVLGGDFRQVLPVVRRATRAQVVDSSLRMSPLWRSIIRLPLRINMRAVSDPSFSDLLLRVGNGEEQTVEDNFIRLPDDMVIPYFDKDASLDALINQVFPSMETHQLESEYIISRAILSTKNEHVDEINSCLIDRFIGEEKVYYSFDKAEDDPNNLYPIEFLNSLTVGGLPPHLLRLKVGCPVILLRNLDASRGLCNGTRLICRAFQDNVIDAEIAVGQHSGKRVFLCKIPLCPSNEDMFPFKLCRKQFPIRLSFSMTINKAQGQTIPYVGVYLPESVFSHGQLYVALSRGTSAATTKVLVNPPRKFKMDGVFTANVVFKEVLSD